MLSILVLSMILTGRVKHEDWEFLKLCLKTCSRSPSWLGLATVEQRFTSGMLLEPSAFQAVLHGKPGEQVPLRMKLERSWIKFLNRIAIF